MPQRKKQCKPPYLNRPTWDSVIGLSPELEPPHTPTCYSNSNQDVPAIPSFSSSMSPGEGLPCLPTHPPFYSREQELGNGPHVQLIGSYCNSKCLVNYYLHPAATTSSWWFWKLWKWLCIKMPVVATWSPPIERWYNPAYWGRGGGRKKTKSDLLKLTTMARFSAIGAPIISRLNTQHRSLPVYLLPPPYDIPVSFTWGRFPQVTVM